jgi:hypothetical protein
VKWLAIFLVVLSGCSTPRRGDGLVCPFDKNLGAVCPDWTVPAETMHQESWVCLKLEELLDRQSCR